MIDTNILIKQNASEDEVFNCWSHTEPSDVVFCRVCPHAYLCRDRALCNIMENINKQEEQNG
jgi:hypothetical protein